MNVTLVTPIRGGEITAPESKSLAVRLAFAYALSGKTPDAITGESFDVQAGLKCAEAVRTALEGRPVNQVSCGESALSLRTLLPIMGALGTTADIVTEGSLRGRTATVFTDLLKEHGMEIGQPETGLYRISGSLEPGTYRLPGNVSSQFVTGLLYALPLLSGDSRIEIDGPLESEPYVRMTLDVLQKSGIEIEDTDRGYSVKGRQKYSIPDGLAPEGDWSGAAFWLFAGVSMDSGRKLTVKGLDPNTLQGDKAVLDILDRMGAEVTVKDEVVTVSPGKLKGIVTDMSQTPDLVPAIVPAAVRAEGITVMRGISRLRLKESDRPKAISELLAGLGGRTEGNDNMLVIPRQRLKGGTVSSFGDHRIAMMAACLRTVTERQVKVTEAEAVAKSYPGFFGDYAKLGGKLEFTK
ncbi:MAG: 3-phosphoshikimate 1-carboxyvinyltransferase [Firmicutes bacterium]|nr:3-phosphoshikimate 1-carboxyvinyltransferase [Bacillota bacterium]